MITDTPVDITKSFSFFGLETGVKFKTVKEAYRRYVKEFHPDLFPAGSQEQTMAQEKLIQAIEHFDQLKLYFETPKAAGAGPSTPKEKPKEEPKNADDWNDWEQHRHEAWDVELRDWIAATRKIELNKNRARGTRDKKWLVYFVRSFVGLSMLVMWTGYFDENRAVESKIVERRERQQQAAASGSPVAMQWYQHTTDVEDHGFGGVDGGANWDKRMQEQPEKIWSMLFWTVIGVAILFSRQAIDLANKLLEKPGTKVSLKTEGAV